MLRTSPWILRLGVADDIRTVYAHGDVLSTYGDAESVPFPVFRQGAVEIPHRGEAPALNRPVDRAVVQDDLVAVGRTLPSEPDGRYGVFASVEFSGNDEIAVTATASAEVYPFTLVQSAVPDIGRAGNEEEYRGEKEMDLLEHSPFN